MDRQMRVVAGLLAVCLLALGSAFGGENGEKIKSKGVITLRSGNSLTVETDEGTTTVIVTPIRKCNTR